MTFSMARPDVRELKDPVEPPNPLNDTVSLLKEAVAELARIRAVGEKAQPGTFVLSPDASSTPDGRIYLSHVRTRIERIVIMANAATILTITIGNGAWLILPTTVAATFTIINLPVDIVLERGVALQITQSNRDTSFAAYAIGYTE